jgi:hypothetical protein
MLNKKGLEKTEEWLRGIPGLTLPHALQLFVTAQKLRMQFRLEDTTSPMGMLSGSGGVSKDQLQFSGKGRTLGDDKGEEKMKEAVLQQAPARDGFL